MSQGLYSHTTRSVGTIVTASIYNSDHQNHITNHNPSMMGGYSDDVSQMQSMTDPGEVGSESLAGSLAAEIERIRFALARITGKTQWYEAPETDLANVTIPPGCFMGYYGSTLPTGWLWANGKTIGDASSGGTARANADTVDLFTVLWNSMTNTEAPVSGGRGANAAADFAAHKTITLPDMCGRVAAGQDDMGGVTSKNRLTGLTGGVNGDTLGAAGGEEAHELTGDENGPHTHGAGSYKGGSHFHHVVSDQSAASGSTLNSSNFLLKARTEGGTQEYTLAGTVASNPAIGRSSTENPDVTGTSGETGSGDAHNNVQPTIISNFIIKL